MYSEIDNRKGVVRTNWKNVRDRVHAVNPEFSDLIDELSPDDLPLYLVYLPYGQLQGDTETPFLTDCDNKVYRLNSPDLPHKIIDELSYGAKSIPLGIVLEKCLEYYIDIPKLNLTHLKIIIGNRQLYICDCGANVDATDIKGRTARDEANPVGDGGITETII